MPTPRKTEEPTPKKPAQETVPSSQSDQPSPQTGTAGSSRRIIRALLFGVIGFVVAVIIIFGVGLYAFGWNDQITTVVTRILPYPAARVGNHLVTYHEYRADISTLNHYYANPDVSAGGSVPTDAQIQELVLNRLVRDYQTMLLARQRGITVSKKEIDDRFGELQSQAGSLETIEQTLTDLYNWDVPTFKKKVIEPFLYREKLQQSLTDDESLSREPLQKAQDILQQLKDGASFEDLASQYSDDTGTAENGGDLGYFGRGVMVSQFEDAAFALDVGEISDIVQSPYGYHIIKLEDKRTKDVDGSQVEEIRARHILIATVQVDTWVTDQLKKAPVNSFTRDNSWDASQGRIVNAQNQTTS